MRIADTHIPIAHDPAEVVSNGVYWVAAVAVCVLAGWSQNAPQAALSGLTAFALVMQGTGSMLFHATVEGEHWGQVIDAVGIQWVMSSLVALSLYATLGVSVWALVPTVLAAWVAWWTQADHISRLASIIVQAVFVLICVWVVAGALICAAITVTIGSAFAIQQLSPVHSLAHSLWHLLSAIAQASAVWVLL